MPHKGYSSITVSDETKELLQKRADELNLSIQDYLKQLLTRKERDGYHD